MKFLISTVIILTQTIGLPVVNAKIDRSADLYETSIAAYKKNEFWGIWSLPISDLVYASSTKVTERTHSYKIKSIQDQDLNTAWVFKGDTTTKENYFEFKFKFPKNAAYAEAYQFKGICDVFNGNCRSLKTWTENARIKTLLVYYNDQPVCYVNLLDTWHFQEFDISRYFKNHRDRKNLDARYEIRTGDRLRFKIVATYKGSKFNDVALSEFLGEGGTN